MQNFSGVLARKQDLEPGDSVEFVPHSLMELRVSADGGVIISRIGQNWFRVSVDCDNQTDIVECPSHMLKRSIDVG
mgnify:FL=1|jgi:hypothetical protein|tara:strand:- start:110 stop:337 length:228 start_codon:yes stop_codon:yes gene_type:complete